jgi:hypothetical protein
MCDHRTTWSLPQLPLEKTELIVMPSETAKNEEADNATIENITAVADAVDLPPAAR